MLNLDYFTLYFRMLTHKYTIWFTSINIIQLGNNCGILQNVIVTNHFFILQLSNITLIILYIVLAYTLHFNTIGDDIDNTQYVRSPIVFLLQKFKGKQDT